MGAGESAVRTPHAVNERGGWRGLGGVGAALESLEPLALLALLVTCSTAAGCYELYHTQVLHSVLCERERGRAGRKKTPPLTAGLAWRVVRGKERRERQRAVGCTRTLALRSVAGSRES